MGILLRGSPTNLYLNKACNVPYRSTSEHSLQVSDTVLEILMQFVCIGRFDWLTF
jgi:hypothetical protein